MTTEAELYLKNALSTVDYRFSDMSFARRRNGSSYRRAQDECRHVIEFTMDRNPRAFPGAKAQLHPTIRVEMPDVTAKAMELVKGDTSLLANVPKYVVGQIIDFTMPENEYRRWIPSTEEDFVVACDDDITGCVERWVVPLLTELSSLDGFICLAENNDRRLLKQHFFWIYVAAAYVLKGDKRAAIHILESRLRPGILAKYSGVLALLHR